MTMTRGWRADRTEAQESVNDTESLVVVLTCTNEVTGNWAATRRGTARESTFWPVSLVVARTCTNEVSGAEAATASAPRVNQH